MTNASVKQSSPPEAKIELFRSLFRGREDVYPRRFESQRTGKSGYTPACANEWVRGLCDKRSVKCVECSHRRFLPITEETIQWHLSGHDDAGRDFVMGVYPMLLDETCFFLAVDFDKKNWQWDATAFLETCRQLKLPVALERSRSGEGGHVWLFFDEAIPAELARNLGTHILTRTMERRPDIGLDSYDRFFPNQNTLPKGGFGNLIALPLQKKPRTEGNSVFLEPKSLTPYEDQWAYLSCVQKFSRQHVEQIVRQGQRHGNLVGVRLALLEENGEQDPWLMPPSRRRNVTDVAGPFPRRIELVLADQIYVPKAALSPSLRNRLIRLASFQNPEFYQAQAMRLSTYDKPRIISCAEEFPQYLGLPRGCLEEVRQFLNDLKIQCHTNDQRNAGTPIDVEFHGELQPEQKRAAEEMLAHDMGVLAAATAFGKTVLAAWLIARRGVNTLILVHRRQLLEQWVERLSTFLGLPQKKIGRFGGGRKKVTGKIDVATIQSLIRKGEVNDLVGEYGHLIVDECHHLSARSFEQVARRVKAKYVTGLSATITRKDGHHPIIFMQCGPVRHRVDARQQAAQRTFRHTVHVCPTGFYSPSAAEDSDARIRFQQLYSELISDESRNRQICDDVLQAVREDRTPIVLTERREHLDALEALLSPVISNLVVLRGGMSKKASKQAFDQLDDTVGSRVLLATGRYIGEGFDDPRLDTLFLTLPVSWRGTIAQYAGRLHRQHESKRDVLIYDYADLNVPMLARMFDKRCRGYEAIGYSILLPASAVPGWPVNVPLPIDPQWKQDYAASVQRLIRDGVDSPLANLFVHVARQHSADAEGVNRARSATEAFLYRRLETLSATTGKFRLNAELPIPFDGRGKMEVDLLCIEAKLVIELDGNQHLHDPDAYRRDRRKDALLQENGYFVLRFLAEDVGKRLNDVLDSIGRTMEHRHRHIHSPHST